VAIIFYAHLLSPFNFQRDIESNFPSLWKAEIEFPLARMCHTNTDEASKRAWMAEYPDVPYQIVEFALAGDPIYITENGMDIHNYKCDSADCMGKRHIIPMTGWPGYRVGWTLGWAELACPRCRKRTSSDSVLKLCRRVFGFPIFNLWDSPQRQFSKNGFVDRILALTQDHGRLPDDLFVPRYLKFLQLMKQGESTLVPTLDIDLLWHTHQLSPAAYKKYCETHVGRQINHVDTIRAAKRSTREENTAALWAERYCESYFDPENTAKTAEIKRRKATIQRDLEDIGRKLAAYDDETKHLKTALEEVRDRLKTKKAALSQAKEAHKEVNAAVAEIYTAIKSIKPTIRFLTLRYYRRSKRRRLQQLQDKLNSPAYTSTYIAAKRREEGRAYDAYQSTLQEESRKMRAYKESQTERKRLEQRLRLEVTKATAAIWRFDNVDGEEQKYQEEDMYDGSWCSIVPSEVQVCVHPIMGIPKNNPRRDRLVAVFGAGSVNPRNKHYYVGYSGLGGALGGWGAEGAYGYGGFGGGCGGGGCNGGGCGGGGCGGGGGGGGGGCGGGGCGGGGCGGGGCGGGGCGGG
jgi:hypothetical protein